MGSYSCENIKQLPPVKRKLFVAALGWLCGIAFGMAVGKITAIAVLLIGLAGILSPRWKNILAFAAVFFALGSACLLIYETKAQRIISRFDGRIAKVTGTVTEIKRFDSSMQITVSGEITGGGNTKIRLFVDDTTIDYYDLVQVAGRLEAAKNTIDFNSEDYLRSQGIFFECDEDAGCIKLDDCQNKPLRAIKRFRDNAVSDIRRYCLDDSGEFLCALLCSETSGVTADDKAAIYRSGLGHLFAVSGSHIVIISSMLGTILLPLIPSARTRSGVIILVVWGFAFFAGLSPSVVRACIMGSISHTAVFFKRRYDSANSLGAAAILITLQCPYALMSVSFQLSFMAAFAIGVVSRELCRGRVTGGPAQTFVSYVCINICSLPICAAYFSELSIISIFVNLLLIPLSSAALILSFIYNALGSKLSLLIKAADFITKLILDSCNAVTGTRLSYVGIRSHAACFIIGILLMLLLLYTALKAKRQRRDILTVCAVYLASLTAMCAVGQLDAKDKIVVFSEDDCKVVTMIIDNNAYVFDINSGGEFRYRINSLLCEEHCEGSYFFINSNAAYTQSRYEKVLYDPAIYFTKAGGGEIIPMEGGVTVEGLTVTGIDGGFLVDTGEGSIAITLEEDQLKSSSSDVYFSS